jgi:hypothetical protein
MSEGRKTFFFEKKKQKTFIPCGPRQPRRARKSAKVFWFFFTKKNSLPPRRSFTQCPTQ